MGTSWCCASLRVSCWRCLAKVQIFFGIRLPLSKESKQQVYGTIRQDRGMKSEAKTERETRCAWCGSLHHRFGELGKFAQSWLEKAGIPVREAVVRISRRSLGRVSVGPDAALYEAEVLWLCVPDGAISDCRADRGAEAGFAGQVVLHSSGALSIEALETARRAGAEIGAIAPVMSFPSEISSARRCAVCGGSRAGPV